jgi:hypothetical protein
MSIPENSAPSSHGSLDTPEPAPALEEDVAVDKRDEIGEQMIRDLPRHTGLDHQSDSSSDSNVDPEPRGDNA